MSNYGGFETIEEIASAGPFAVFTARKGPGGPIAFAVKVYRTTDMLADPDVVEREAAAFLEVAELQRTLPAGGASAGSGHWAPVHALGRESDAVYYVTDLYPVTVQKLVDSRRALTPREIAHVLGGAIAGLEELRTSQGRGHGALIPSNVLIGSNEIEGATVALIDLEPASKLDSLAEVADQRGLAKLLALLATNREPPRAGAVAVTPEWQKLGSSGELLRQLCESLLNVQAGQLVPVEKVRAVLAEVAKAKFVDEERDAGGKLKWVAVSAVVLLALGGAGWYFTRGQAPPKPVEIVNPVVAWVPGDAAALRQKLADVRPRIPAHQRDAQEEVDRSLAELNEWSASVASLKERSGAVSQVEADDFGKRIERYDGDFIALQQKITELADEFAVKDASADPRGTRPARWLARELTALERNLPEAERLASDAPEVRASLAKFREEYDKVRVLVPELRAAAAPADPTQAGEFRNQLTTTQDEVVKLSGMVAELRQTSEDAVKAMFEAAAQSAGSLASANLQSRFSSQVKAARAAVFESKGQGWSYASKELARLTTLYKSIETAFDLKPQLPDPAGSGIQFSGLDAFLSGRREEVIESLPDLSLPEVPSEQDQSRLAGVIADKVKVFKQDVADAQNLYESAVAAWKMAQDGYGLNDRVGEASIALFEQRWRGSGRAYSALSAGISGVQGLVDSLKSVAELRDPGRLAGVIRDPSQPLSGVLMAWVALPQNGFPASISDLVEAEALHNTVAERATRSLKGGPREEEVKAQARRQFLQAWMMVVERPNLSSGDMEAALAMAANVPGASDVIEREAWLKYNRERWQLSGRVAQIPDAAETKEQIDLIYPHVESFARDTEKLGLGQRADVESFRGELRPFLEKKIITMKQMGPGAAGWAYEDAQGVARYRWTGKRGEHVLEFRRLELGAEEVTYLCTTEMSAGLFIDLVEGLGKWEDLRGVDKNGPMLMEGSDLLTKRGVRTVKWQPNFDSGKLVVNTPEMCGDGNKFTRNGLGWHSFPARLTMCEFEYFPAGAEPAPPEEKHPIDWVSPQAAIYVSRLVGCRLPSSAEWLKAVQVGRNIQPNLRDPSVLQQMQHARSIAATARVDFAVDPPFENTLRLQEDLPGAKDEEQSAAAQDGSLYFSRVDTPSSPFCHLVGNVWEYTFEQPLELEKALRKPGSDSLAKPTAAEIMKWLNRAMFDRNIRVIGGSALSSPSIPVDQPLMPKRTDALYGWSDVGFRLAFSTGAGAGGAGSPKEQLIAVLRRSPYLSKPSQN